VVDWQYRSGAEESQKIDAAFNRTGLMLQLPGMSQLERGQSGNYDQLYKLESSAAPADWPYHQMYFNRDRDFTCL